MELSGFVAARQARCFEPEFHDHAPEYFVVDDDSGQIVQLIGVDEQLHGIDPQQKVQVTLAPGPEASSATESFFEPSGSSGPELVVQKLKFLPMQEGAEAKGVPEIAGGGANTMQILDCLLVFISTDTDGCMTSETNARNLLWDNPTNANEGMQAITKGRYGIRLGNGTGVPDDHTIDLLLNVNSGDHDTGSIQNLANDKLFVTPVASGGLGLNRADYDRVLMFAPDNITNDNFTAYAYYPTGNQLLNGLSMYGRSYGNDRMNGYLHELGHNFGFPHSSKGGSEYGDGTCVMGSSSNGQYTQTYNVAKLMATNWLDTFNNATGTDASLNLSQDITLNVYPLSSDLEVVDETVALKISGTDFYVSYHRNDLPYGYVRGGSSLHDKVFIHSRGSSSFDRSFQVQALSEEDVFTSGSLEVQFGEFGPSNTYATVSIDVDDGNTMPQLPQTVYGTARNQALNFGFPATDADGDTITYATLSNPTNGTLSGSYPALIYTPDNNFTGSDTFRITASDALISNYITVTVLTFVDSDADGLDDDWELLYFGNLSQGPTDNPDNDQENNLAEFLNGSDPIRAPTQFVNPVTGTVIGTLGSYQNNPDWDRDEAWDGDFSTYYDALNATGDWTGLDLRSPKKFSLIRYAARSGWGSRMNGGQFQGSNTADFSSGVETFHTVNTDDTPSGSFTDQLVNNAGSFRYIRYIGPTDGYCNIAEIEFYEDGAPDAPTGLTATSVTGAVDLDWDDNGDADGDGMDDARETTVLGSTSGNGSGDLDANGITDYFQFIYGTTSGSYPGFSLVVAPTPSASGVTYTWTVQSEFVLGTDYILQYSTDMSGWNPLVLDGEDSLTPMEDEANNKTQWDLILDDDLGSPLYLRFRNP